MRQHCWFFIVLVSLQADLQDTDDSIQVRRTPRDHVSLRIQFQRTLPIRHLHSQSV